MSLCFFVVVYIAVDEGNAQSPKYVGLPNKICCLFAEFCHFKTEECRQYLR